MAEPTASERMFASIEAFFQRLTQLTPGELAFNIGLSVAVFLAAFLIAVLFRRMIHIGVRSLPGPADAQKQIRTTRVARFARLVVHLGLAVTALVLALRIWGVDLFAWMSQGIGEQLTGMVIHLAVLLVLGFACFELAGFIIDRLLARLVGRASEARKAAQLRTLGPILRSFTNGVVVIVFALMILAEAGVQIGPLLAGAGVVGIAIGFGAQTLVKDLLTGIFLIAEDIVSVGDIAEIQGFGGVVEEMTLRTIRLRGYDGVLHVFPYNEAQIIHNLTKTFSYYVFQLQISYESDVDKAMALMRETSDSLTSDSEFADRILEPIDIAGVDAFADSGVVIKARIKTLPGQQWGVGREFNRRIKRAFEAEDVQIPYPHVKLIAPDAATTNGAAT